MLDRGQIHDRDVSDFIMVTLSRFWDQKDFIKDLFEMPIPFRNLKIDHQHLELVAISDSLICCVSNIFHQDRCR